MDTITIGGWNVRINAIHLMTRTDSDGFVFRKRFCIGAALWNDQPVYFALGGSTGGNVCDRFDSIESMRTSFLVHMQKGWVKA